MVSSQFLKPCFRGNKTKQKEKKSYIRETQFRAKEKEPRNRNRFNKSFTCHEKSSSTRKKLPFFPWVWTMDLWVSQNDNWVSLSLSLG